jgi:putative ABC transport system substrate-binding protein
LVSLSVTVLAAGPVAEQSAKAATSTIPIVFMTAQDPVGYGLVASMNRPGGNLTGATVLSANLEAKRVGLLRALVPRASAIAILVNPTESRTSAFVEEMRLIERTIGVPINVANAADEADFASAYATIAQASAVLVTGSLLFLNRRERIVALAEHHRIPAIYFAREFAEAGGLMSYSGSAIEAWQHVGRYTGRILKGEKAGDLPVTQPTKFELVINLKTAKAQGLNIPPTLLAIADEVIEWHPVC